MMFAPFALLLFLVGAGVGSIFALRRPTVVLSGDGLSRELRLHAKRSARWSLAGVAGGLAGALVISSWDSLGRGLLLAAPLFGLIVLVTVCLGEVTAGTPGSSHRRASLDTRRVRDYLPRRLTILVAIATAILTMSMIGATLAGSTDDLGRAGRSLTVACPSGVIGSRGPWPGWFYAAPLLAMVGLGVAAALVALLDITRRSRLDDLRSWSVDEDHLNAAPDDELRRRSARNVLAALGVAVTIPLSGVATLGADALAGTDCLPALGRAAQYGWSVVIPLSTILLGWSAMTLVVDGASAAIRRDPVR
jgi:TRAP-type C4-dicarboxylate transport system permease small subunit